MRYYFFHGTARKIKGNSLNVIYKVFWELNLCFGTFQYTIMNIFYFIGAFISVICTFSYMFC